MMTNLFSSFDPSSSVLISLNWMSALIMMIFMTPMFWKIPSKTNITMLNIKKSIFKEFKTILGNNSSKGTAFVFVSIFTLIMMNNFLGLFPYIFTASSHLTMTLTLALPFWMAFMMYGWINNTNHMLAHMVPNGTPSLLMPFMVLIEMISNIIRPITLSVRLMANMVAGHLLMTLLGNQTSVMTNLLLMSLILTQILLLTLESAVAMIQAYVFAVLSTLYSTEVINH